MKYINFFFLKYQYLETSRIFLIIVLLLNRWLHNFLTQSVFPGMIGDEIYTFIKSSDSL